MKILFGESHTLKNLRPLLASAAVGAAAAALVALDAFYLEPDWLSFETIDIPIADLPASFDGYRIALMADFQYPRWTNADFVRKAISMAMEFQPDLVALPGDFVDLRRGSVCPDLTGLFDAVGAAPDGAVGVLGNHDHWVSAGGVRREIAAHTPIGLIENTSLYVERGGDRIAVGGVGDMWEGVVDPERAFENVPPDVPRILLAHNPDAANRRIETRIDLQLSGHTHGGQVRIPFGPAIKTQSIYGNQFRAGLVEGRHHPVYITRGVCTVRRVRFCCRPEVTGITLRKATSAQIQARKTIAQKKD